MSNQLMAGKRGLIMGLANDKSIAAAEQPIGSDGGSGESNGEAWTQSATPAVLGRVSVGADGNRVLGRWCISFA